MTTNTNQAGLTVTIEVPAWIVEQILSGQFTAVSAAAQLVEAAVTAAK